MRRTYGLRWEGLMVFYPHRRTYYIRQILQKTNLHHGASCNKEQSIFIITPSPFYCNGMSAIMSASVLASCLSVNDKTLIAYYLPLFMLHFISAMKTLLSFFHLSTLLNMTTVSLSVSMFCIHRHFELRLLFFMVQWVVVLVR